MIDRTKLLKQIKAARLAAGYSQLGAARRFGCTRQCWLQWENGSKGISVDTIDVMAVVVELEMTVTLKKRKRKKRT